MADTELLPCPFCGSTEVSRDAWESLTAEGPGCDECGATAATDADWNRRATPPSPSTAPESSQFANRENGSAYNSRLTGEVDERAAFVEAARIAASFGLGRPLVERRPNDLIRGRWEGEQAASGHISRMLLERAALASRPAEVDDEGLPKLPEETILGTSRYGTIFRGYTAEQYRQGQRDSVAADRARMLRQVLDCYSPDDTASDYQDKIRALMAAPSHTTNKEK